MSQSPPVLDVDVSHPGKEDGGTERGREMERWNGRSMEGLSPSSLS